MPFKKQVKATDPEQAGTVVNASVATEKKEKKNDVAADVKAKRELYEKNQEIEELKKALELAKQQPIQATNAPDQNAINELKAQVQLLASQVRTGATGDKLKFRMPTSADLVKPGEERTFTARSVFYVVGSYLDKHGIEQLPPFKLIIFTYAASDIRKEGREEEIKNFSQYTTNLQPEIDFLRNSPYYGITYSENTNEMMNEDTKETQFKVAAATALQSATPEAVFAKADELKIPNWRSKSPSELRGPIITKMVEEYKKREDEIQKDIIQRNMLRQQPANVE
jgi:hypothetical protein